MFQMHEQMQWTLFTAGSIPPSLSNRENIIDCHMAAVQRGEELTGLKLAVQGYDLHVGVSLSRHPTKPDDVYFSMGQTVGNKQDRLKLKNRHTWPTAHQCIW